MPNLITLIANNDIEYQFVDEIIGLSSTVDVYWGSNKRHVLSLYRNPVRWQEGRGISTQIKQVQNLINEYAPLISKNAKGEYWRDLFNYPLAYVEWEGRFGVIIPTFNKQFFFEKGRFQGKEKVAKWFVSAKLRNKHLETTQKGTWNNYYLMCLKIAQMTKLLHQVGLAYSDLSYNTILIDPLTGSACFISYDQLTILNNLSDILPTTDFAAPEYIANRTSNIDANRYYIPNVETNNHALAVLIYTLLLYRHPLRGGKVHDMDAAKDEKLTMGAKALFIEHPTDKSNRPKADQLHPSELPQWNIKNSIHYMWTISQGLV